MSKKATKVLIDDYAAQLAEATVVTDVTTIRIES